MKEAAGMDRSYWTHRYREGRTGWDIGYVSRPIKEFVDQLQHPEWRILVPGAGNGYEVEYLYRQGFRHTCILDISELPLENFLSRVPDFPRTQLIREDFFQYQGGPFDLILEQTFFCALPLNKRPDYALQMHRLLSKGGLLAGLWFNIPLEADKGPPFGGSREEYLAHLEPFFITEQFSIADNSIPPRSGREFFGLFRPR